MTATPSLLPPDNVYRRTLRIVWLIAAILLGLAWWYVLSLSLIHI